MFLCVTKNCELAILGQKRCYCTLVHNFAKYCPIVVILSPICTKVIVKDRLHHKCVTVLLREIFGSIWLTVTGGPCFLCYLV